MGLLKVIDRDGVEHEVQGAYGQKIMEILRELDLDDGAIAPALRRRLAKGLEIADDALAGSIAARARLARATQGQ